MRPFVSMDSIGHFDATTTIHTYLLFHSSFLFPLILGAEHISSVSCVLIAKDPGKQGRGGGGGRKEASIPFAETESSGNRPVSMLESTMPDRFH